MKAQESIQAYETRLAPELAETARLLRTEIEHALPGASSKVWHGHPVWFDGENPVVGYDARIKTVRILFWNGRALDEPGLSPVGKDRAAAKEFAGAASVDRTELRRCLDKARANVFDSAGHYRKLRERAKRVRAAAPSRGGKSRATGKTRG
jgi:hypothetical protein